MFQNQKKLRNFLYIFLILFTIFQACKPKYQEEIKPLENPVLALSKKASVWWQNKQSQPKPQRRDGEKQPPDYITTFYPNWSKATHHHTTNQQTKVIVPLLRNAKAWYFYPTIRRAVFTLNPDSSVADAQIIEVITNSNELLNKYETQLFLNPDATNLKDFTGYVLEYDVQYTRTKFTGYTNGIIAKDNASIATDGGQGNTNWDCGDNNPIDTNPTDPSNNNPPNGSGGATNWVIFIGGTPGSSPGSNTSGNLLGPPLNPMTTISGNFGGGGYSGVVTPTIIQPIQLADVGGAAAQMGDIGGLIPGGSVDVGDPIESEILERKTHDTGDSRKNNGNPCGDGGGNNSYDAPRMIVDESITSNPKLNEIFEVVKNTQSFNELTSCFRSNNFFFNDPNNPNRIDPEKFTTLVVKAEAFTGDKANANGETKVKLIDGKWCVVIVINTNVLNRPKWDIARTFFHEAFHAKLASMLYRVPRPADAFNESQKKLFERLPANDPYRMVFDSWNTPNAVIPNEGLKSYIDHKLMAQQANRDKMIDYIKDYFGGTVPFPATVTVQEADEMLQMVVCRGIEKRVRELDSTFTFERISDGFLKMKNYLPNN